MNGLTWLAIIMLAISCLFGGIGGVLQGEEIKQLETRIERLEK